MPAWAGKWEGGRYYLDEAARPVYFIEKMRGGLDYSIKLPTFDEEIAKGMLGLFLQDAAKFSRSLQPTRNETPSNVYITDDRINLYMQSIRGCVKDHRDARRAYLLAWSEKRIDLATMDKRALREKLAQFDGGHRGRVETLNAFANFLVEEGDLNAWKRLVNPFGTKQTRAARVIYTLETLSAKLKALPAGPTRDLFFLRVTTGMHHTELAQLYQAKTFTGPLPDKGTGIRILGGDHEIQGVLQVKHKNGQRHRVSVDKTGLEVALRLQKEVPSRVGVWKRLQPEIIPSNLRHTFVTLMGEKGRIVEYEGEGVQRAVVAQLVGHRAGSTMTADRYENRQVPPMARLPLDVCA